MRPECSDWPAFSGPKAIVKEVIKLISGVDERVFGRSVRLNESLLWETCSFVTMLILYVHKHENGIIWAVLKQFCAAFKYSSPNPPQAFGSVRACPWRNSQHPVLLKF